MGLLFRRPPHLYSIEQLSLLRDQLQKIADAAFADDADALVSNGQYLKEKFHAPLYLS